MLSTDVWDEVQDMINWWQTSFGEEEVSHVVQSIRNQNISQGKVTREFELRLSEYLGVDHVVATSSGSTALMLSLIAVGISPGDEVIVPNRTWIATAHAAHLLGAKVVLVDVEPNRPVLNLADLEAKITPRTKAIMPVHMNGRAVDMKALKTVAKKHGLHIIEDAAQAIGSKNESGFLGTQSDIGCFSLSVAKTIATGQGGFAVTNRKELAQRLRAIRTHGVENVIEPKEWNIAGFNFRFTDIQASIGLEQLKRLPDRLNRLREIYRMYAEGLKDLPISLIEVDLERGEVPVYNEYLCPNREALVNALQERGVETRPFYPDLDYASYFPQSHRQFPNSRKFGLEGLYLPSGPSQTNSNIQQVISEIKAYYG